MRRRLIATSPSRRQACAEWHADKGFTPDAVPDLHFVPEEGMHA